MTANRWWELREWLTVPEAAQLLSDTSGIATSEADVLRLALDGHLKLWVYFPAGANATLFDNDGRQPPRSTTIEGLWELPMIGTGRLEVEQRYQSLRGLAPFTMDIMGLEGAIVQRDGVRYRLDLGWAREPASALPEVSVIVVRTDVLQEFSARNAKPAPEAKITPVEKPVHTRERNNFLIMIAALAKAAGIDVSQASKAGETISAMVAELGHDIAPNTIARQLRNYKELFSAPTNDKPRSRSKQQIGN